MVIIKTDKGEYTCQTVDEVTKVLEAVMVSRDKAHTLATGIIEVADNRPTDVPPLIVNLNRDDS